MTALRSWCRRVATAVTVLAALTAAGVGSPSASAALAAPATPSAAAPAAPHSTPLFAYFYQWFDPTSWNRAKIDYPALGKYSSDDVNVLRQQIEWAKGAGITGFVVSWKSTDVDNRRLETLMKVATAEKFQLAMIYQGLDFSRKPLPVARVAADFSYFQQHFAPDPVFYRMAGKPLTIWSGTWAYSAAEVATVTRGVRPAMLVLSTEKSLAGYQRISALTDGDAYYWSSVNPDTNSNYGAKLDQLSKAIHQDQKYWIAPFAPGFDARLVGGQQTVDRKDGQTLRTEYANAVRSSPDLLGLISWNEFSENTYVEPSQKYGNLFIQVLSQLRNAGPTASAAAAASDSSGAAPPGSHLSAWPNVLRLGGFLLFLIICVALIGRARRKRNSAPPPDQRVSAPHDLVRHD